MLKSAHISKAVLTATVSGCLYLLSTTSGFAGFEWVPKERPATPPPAPAQQEVPMQVMEAPVAHVTGEPLQAPASIAAPAPVMMQPAPAPAQIIQQIPAPAPAPEVSASQNMTPSPFDAPAPMPPVAAPMAAPVMMQAAPAPIVAQPAPQAPVQIPQRQAIIPAPVTESQPAMYERPALNIPPAVADMPTAQAEVEAMQQQQNDAAIEAEKLMQSMDAVNPNMQDVQPELYPAPAPAPVIADTAPRALAPQQEPIIIPAMDDTAMEPAPTAPAVTSTTPLTTPVYTEIEPSPAPEAIEEPQMPSVDYTAQALAQMGEPRIEQNTEVSAPNVEPLTVTETPLQQTNVESVVQSDTMAIETPAQISEAQETVVSAPSLEPSENLSIAEQAALKAEAAKAMLSERAAKTENANAMAMTEQQAEEAPAEIPSLDVVNTTTEMPVIEQAEKEVIILPPVDTVTPSEDNLIEPAGVEETQLSVNEQLEMEMSQPGLAPENADLSAQDVIVNDNSMPSAEMLAPPEADQLVNAQENIIIPAIDTTMMNEAPVEAPLDTAETQAPLAPEARAVSADEAEAVEMAVQTEAPLSPVTEIVPQAIDTPSGDYAVVYGFGEDMPLALALQQIVPEGYAYSFTKSVNPGARVNWEGDRPWNVVLNDTLAQAGLKAHIAGNSVTVMQTGDQFGATQSPVTREHPEAKTFDVMWDLEPAAGKEQNVQGNNTPADGLIAPMEPVSLNTGNMPQTLTNKTIKDPGEIPSQQPLIDSASIQALQPAPIQNESVTVAAAPTDAVTELDMTPTKAQGTAKAGVWNADQGQSLKKVLYTWSQKGNVQIIWEASHDYIVADNVRVEGTMDEAMVTLFKVSMAEDTYPSVRIIQSQKNSGTTAMVVVQDPSTETINEAAADAQPSEG